MRRTLLVPMVGGALTLLLVASIAPGLASDRSSGSPAAAPAAAAPAADPAVAETPRTAQAVAMVTTDGTSIAASPEPLVTALKGASEAAGSKIATETSAPTSTTAPTTERSTATEKVVVRPVVHPKPRIRLSCAAVRTVKALSTDPMAVWPAAKPAIACRWAVAFDGRVRAYQVWRVVDAPGHGPRELVATIAAGKPHRYLDRAVRLGHTYTYAIIALGRDGSKLAVSPVATVRLPAPFDRLRLGCAIATNGDVRGIACRWSEARHPGAAGYVLYRSVDGGPREKVYRTGLDGRRGYFDTDLKPGQTVRYAVILVNKAGERIGQGGPVVVRIPAPRSEAPAAVGTTPAEGDAAVRSRG